MPQLNESQLKQIIARRDSRYDGRFYFGVKTTKIYCRPVCPAKPKPENIRIFKSASEAEREGYRPCLRCRPDAAPGSKLLDGTLNTVARGLRIIADSRDDDLNVQSLADSLGVSDRHLRRLFEEHLGASPVEIMISRRLHFAKQIIESSSLPFIDVAFAAGFGSLRRFNEVFKEKFHRSPREFRRDGAPAAAAGLVIKLPIRPPYDWEAMLRYLERHETYGIEAVSDGCFERFVPLGNSFGKVRVSFLPRAESLQVECINLPVRGVRFLLARVKLLFDTDHNPAHLPREKGLSPGGIRVAGCFEPFEVAVGIILGQSVSTRQAKAMLKKLVIAFGKRIGFDADREIISFPSPARLKDAAFESLGVPRVKAQCLRDVSAAVEQGEVRFDAQTKWDEVAARLQAIKGIGPWTVAMIGMRCLGDPDAFPETDLIVQRAVKEQKIRAAAWVPFRAYLTHCLWRDFGSALVNGNNKRGKKNGSAISKV